jgi:tetratricopeptide repeat protein 21B
MGSIAEREAAHQDAAAAYERAWGLAGGHTDGKNEQDGGTGSLASGCCGLGYKLAFNHLKAGRLTDAISVAQAVLRADPGFPRISADVLERARALLRP